MAIKPRKKARKSATRASLYLSARKELETILTVVLQDAKLRRRSGVSLEGRQSVSVGLDVSLISEPAMKRLNRKFRGKNEATDILSFPTPTVFRSQGHLGDLVICLKILKSQAKAGKLTEKQELRVLLVHGVLHLLGLDHEKSRRGAIEMAGWEERILKVLSAAKTTPGLISRARAAK